MKVIHLNKNISFKFARTTAQQCLYCQRSMGKGVGVTFNNAGDGLILKKNLWLHIGCIQGFCNLLTTSLEKYGQQLLGEAL